MRALQKLIRNSASTGLTIPRTFLHHLGWMCGESVIIELLEDQSLRIRRPELRDFQPIQAPRLIPESPDAVKP